ncbi:MAG: biopolymer transporter ExbD [Lentimicrobiaceae bacterium]|jgi:biopolymer transport protein ExbD|nr:biopolymer transporter ExbD [Lentimicrobiaceae bacterium]
MAIQMRNKRDTSFSMSSMSDMVFLLLIFFMLTSTLVAPNAIKLLLPNSNSKTMSKQTVTVYINKARNIYVEDRKVEPVNLENIIYGIIRNETAASIVLRSDKTAPVQDIVVVIDAVNEINSKHGTQHKVILATKPKR